MRRILGLVLVVCLLAGSTLAPVASAAQPVEPEPAADRPGSLDTSAATQSGTGEITYFSMDGRGYIYDQEDLVADHPGPPYVWASESIETQLTLHPRPTTNNKTVCGRILDGEGEAVDGEAMGCTTWNTSTSPKGVTLELSAWPAGASGTYYLDYEFFEEVPATEAGNESADAEGNDTEAGGTERVLRDEYRTEVYVISKQGDLDDDGLSNAREVEVGTDYTRADTDGDGLSDRAEIYEYDSDPLSADSAGDGLEDGTVAGLGLPPTVPYVVHGVATLGVVVIGALVVAGVRLRRALRARSGGGGYPASDRGPGGQAVPGDDWFPSTKEDEVVAVLREHDGRMRQADLVDETEWSKATVSRLLSTLEEEGRVEKIRVGRGNVVRLTDSDPPLDDDERTQTPG